MMFLYNLNTGLQQITGSLGISIHKGRVLVIDFIIVKYIYKNYINIQIIICQYYFESEIKDIKYLAQ